MPTECSFCRLRAWDSAAAAEAAGVNEVDTVQLGLHFGSKKIGKISIVFEDLSKNSVLFRTEVKPQGTTHTNMSISLAPPRDLLPPTLARSTEGSGTLPKDVFEAVRLRLTGSKGVI